MADIVSMDLSDLPPKDIPDSKVHGANMGPTWVRHPDSKVHGANMGPTWVRHPDIKVYGASMGPTWVMSASDGPHVGHMNLAIWDSMLLTVDGRRAAVYKHSVVHLSRIVRHISRHILILCYL